MSSGPFKNIIKKICLQLIYIYLIYMYKQDLRLNNEQWLICHQTQPKQAFSLTGCHTKVKEQMTHSRWSFAQNETQTDTTLSDQKGALGRVMVRKLDKQTLICEFESLWGAPFIRPCAISKWYLMLPCFTLCIIRYVSRVKWSNLGKGVASFLYTSV